MFIDFFRYFPTIDDFLHRCLGHLNMYLYFSSRLKNNFFIFFTVVQMGGRGDFFFQKSSLIMLKKNFFNSFLVVCEIIDVSKH